MKINIGERGGGLALHEAEEEDGNAEDDEEGYGGVRQGHRRAREVPACCCSFAETFTEFCAGECYWNCGERGIPDNCRKPVYFQKFLDSSKKIRGNLGKFGR